MRPLIHGATYFAELHQRVSQMRHGDLLLFVDWRGDSDERLKGTPDSAIGTVLADAARRGVDVRVSSGAPTGTACPSPPRRTGIWVMRSVPPVASASLRPKTSRTPEPLGPGGGGYDPSKRKGRSGMKRGGP